MKVYIKCLNVMYILICYNKISVINIVILYILIYRQIQIAAALFVILHTRQCDKFWIECPGVNGNNCSNKNCVAFDKKQINSLFWFESTKYWSLGNLFDIEDTQTTNTKNITIDMNTKRIKSSTTIKMLEINGW